MQMKSTQGKEAYIMQLSCGLTSKQNSLLVGPVPRLITSACTQFCDLPKIKFVDLWHRQERETSAPNAYVFLRTLDSISSDKAYGNVFLSISQDQRSYLQQPRLKIVTLHFKISLFAL